VKNQKRIKNRSFFFLISFLFLTSLLSIKTLKKLDLQDIRISGSELFSLNDVVKNSSLNFPIRLIFINANLLEKELKQNLSLKNVSVNRELFPFGLKVDINSRIPIAYGERILNDEKILGFIDKDGIFINKQNVDEKNFNKLTIQVFGWNEKFKKILSEIFIAIENYELEIVIITFSSDGFLTVEEKDLKTIFLGFKPNLINNQFQKINYLKNEFKKNSFSKKIDNQLEENYVISHINKICENESILKIGQNIKYDIRILNKYGVMFNSIADTMLISYSIDNGIYKHN